MRASDSRASNVGLVTNEFASGLSEPVGSASTSTSYTEFVVPSTSKSSRKLNRCWWFGAARPGAIISAHRRPSPFAEAPFPFTWASFSGSEYTSW